jgi:hypothetical protein
MMEEQRLDEDYICPITQQCMVHPVVAGDGFSYEEAAIEKWLETHNRSPTTNLRLYTKALVPNLSLKRAIARSSQRKKLRSAAPSCTEQQQQQPYEAAEAADDGIDTIKVRTITSKEWCFRVLLDQTTVDDVRLMIQQELDIGRDSQRLIFAGKVLNAEVTLRECGIGPWSVVHLILRLPGG